MVVDESSLMRVQIVCAGLVLAFKERDLSSFIRHLVVQKGCDVYGWVIHIIRIFHTRITACEEYVQFTVCFTHCEEYVQNTVCFTRCGIYVSVKDTPSQSLNCCASWDDILFIFFF